ncbi:MAG3450 family membrane protein [Mycoplasma marinum]|uniref:Uncharacterized protein n=1 Tax=Mycoplasma marinum TaxID=1937190 RepID=A0A4R0XMM6_9MOLU|nr:hypothetical protein [Mycoplasma marinum]TCG11787.1 hypothetical protein C4B24_01395 [Mycoplasma marinum]
MAKKNNDKKDQYYPKQEFDITLKRTGGWTQTLVTFVFILVPAMVMWVFLSKDFGNKQLLTTGELWGVAIGFIFYSILISIFLIWIRLIWIDTLNFTVPVAIVLMAIMLSQDVVIWGRALIAIGMIFTALPVNMITVRYIENLAIKNNNKH